jgi:nicotinate phosphoribosyltransferase
MKLSKDKITLPGRKQVFRFKNQAGVFTKDVIAISDELIEAEPLLAKVMEKGKITCKLPSLNEIRAKALDSLSKLPAEYKLLTNASTYPVELSQKLEDLIESTKSQLTINEINNKFT